jgi:hypothetical protein
MGQSGFGPHSRARCTSNRSRNGRLIGIEHPHCSRQQLPSLRQVMAQSASTRHVKASASSRPNLGGTRRSESGPDFGSSGGAPGKGRGVDDSARVDTAGTEGTVAGPAGGSGPAIDDPLRQDVTWLVNATTAEKPKRRCLDIDIVIFLQSLKRRSMQSGQFNRLLHPRRKLTASTRPAKPTKNDAVRRAARASGRTEEPSIARNTNEKFARVKPALSTALVAVRVARRFGHVCLKHVHWDF